MQYVEIIGDLDAELVQGLGDFLAAEGGQALQPEFENGPRLGFRKLAGAILAERMARSAMSVIKGAMSRAARCAP